MGKSNSDIENKNINLISSGTVITGDVISQGDIRIDGELKGNLTSQGRVVVGNTGIINGEIECRSSEVSGKIIGKIQVKELLSLKATSLFEGDIVTGKLTVEPGAVFNASCKMNGEVNTGGKR
ncbi:polymer-forming cytoskeletal protein [Puteibacter caeruleilacunae]|nr:polymer-forming cytoskeletal protein [Puteibacter caeruleilacunae]